MVLKLQISDKLGVYGRLSKGAKSTSNITSPTYVEFKTIPEALHKAVQKRHELRILRVISLKFSKNLAKPTFSESFVFKHR